MTYFENLSEILKDKLIINPCFSSNMSEKTSVPNISEIYDFIIVGAGPAGLTAGITAKKNGMKVVVVEKGSQPGPKPRGETIHYYPLLDEILGKDFLPSISKHDTPLRLMHSPNNKFTAIVDAKKTSYIFEWRRFIGRLEDIATEINLEIRINTEVLAPIIKNEICEGVILKNEKGEEKRIYGRAILACDGFESIIGRYFKIDYSHINNPIVKCLVSNANIDIKCNKDLEIFIVPNKALPKHPRFPPCAAFIFPRSGKELEAGIMLFMTIAPKMQGVNIPTSEEIMDVWNEFKETYPIFCDYFKGAKIEYEELTAISSARLVKNYIPFPGVVLIGDSAGFVESTGSSGLYFSMAMAHCFSSLLSNELKNNSSEDLTSNKTIWAAQKIKYYKKEFEKTEEFKHISKTYKLIHLFHWYVFKRRGTAERINEKWTLLAKLLQKAKP